MTGRRESGPRKGWLTVADTAALLGITPQGVRSSYLPELDDADVDRSGKAMLVRFSAVHELMIERRTNDRIRSMMDADPLLAGDSPALERYRMAKAQHAELDLEERKGELVERERVREVLARWASILRRTGEQLTKKHGNDARMLFTDALDSCRLVIKEFEPKTEGTEQ